MCGNHSYTNFGTTMGSLTAPTPTTHTTASPSSSTAAGAPGPAYKMEPGDPGAVYYPGAGPAVGGDTPGDHQASAAFQPSHPIPGVSGPELGATDFMQTLQTYIGQPVDMQHPDTGQSCRGFHVLDNDVFTCRGDVDRRSRWHPSRTVPSSGV